MFVCNFFTNISGTTFFYSNFFHNQKKVLKGKKFIHFYKIFVKGKCCKKQRFLYNFLQKIFEEEKIYNFVQKILFRHNIFL